MVRRAVLREIAALAAGHALHCHGDFGSYCLAYDEPTPTNTQEPRGRDCICLGPTGNWQGTYKFFHLKTMQVIKRKLFEQLPVPDRIIRQVERIGRRNKQDGGGGIRYANRNNVVRRVRLERGGRSPRGGRHTREGYGVMREEDVEAVMEEPQGEDQGNEVGGLTRLAAENADFGPRERAIIRDALVTTETRNITFNVHVNVGGQERETNDAQEDVEDEEEIVFGVDP